MEGPASAKKQQQQAKKRQRSKVATEGVPQLTAEQRKRRARHIIWDLEDEIEQHVKAIADLERLNQELQRRQELMAKTVAVRERQVQMLQHFGVGEGASTSHLLLKHLASTSTNPAAPRHHHHHAHPPPRQTSFTPSGTTATNDPAASSCIPADSATGSASLSAPRDPTNDTHHKHHNSTSGAGAGAGAYHRRGHDDLDVVTTGDLADMLEMAEAAVPSSCPRSQHHHNGLPGHHRREDNLSRTTMFVPHLGAAGCGMECGGETGNGLAWPCFGGEVRRGGGGSTVDFPWLAPCHGTAPASADYSGASSATHMSSHLNNNKHGGGGLHAARSGSQSGRRGAMGPPGAVAGGTAAVGTCAAGHLCSIFLHKVLAGVSAQLGSGHQTTPPTPGAARFRNFSSSNNNNKNDLNDLNNNMAMVLHQHGNDAGMPKGLIEGAEEYADELLCCAAGAGAQAASPTALASCRALGQLVARCRPPGTSAASDGDVMPLVAPASVAGGAVCGVPAAAVQRDLSRLVLLGEAQVMDLHKRASQELSQLLFAAEDATSPGSLEAQQHVEAAVHTIRTLGSLLKVCNPSMACVASRPLSAGLDTAGDAHWDSVARALLLTPQQAQDVATLDGMRLQWLARVQQEHVVVSRLLADVMRGIDAAKWKTSSAKVELSEAEMLVKLQRVAGAGRWVLVLVDDVLSSHILTSTQVARWMVHSYPYVPDSCALVEAICRVYPTGAAQGPAPPEPAQATPQQGSLGPVGLSARQHAFQGCAIETGCAHVARPYSCV